MADLQKHISNEIRHKESNETHNPCFKHAAESLSLKSNSDVSSGAELCDGCSKTMLSYIFLIQNMLDGLARKLSKDEDLSCCIQCMRQKSRHPEDLQSEENFKNNDLKSEKLVNSNGMVQGECEPISSVPTSPELKAHIGLLNKENSKNNDLKSENLVNSNGIVNGECEQLSSVPTSSELKSEAKANQKLEQNINPIVTSPVEVTSEPKKQRKVSSRRNSRRISREIKENANKASSESSVSRNGWQTDFLYNVSSSIEPKYVPYSQQMENKSIPAALFSKRNSSQEDTLASHKENALLNNHSSLSTSSESSTLTPCSQTSFFSNLGPPSIADSGKPLELLDSDKAKVNYSSGCDCSATESSPDYHKSEPDDCAESDYLVTKSTLNQTEAEVDDSSISDYSGIESNLSRCDSLKSDYSGTESLDREEDSTKFKTTENGKTFDQSAEKWRTLHDSFGDCVSAKDRESSEAFVTICRNNAEALGCLVLGSSLLLSRTSRKLCVLVFDDVHPVFKESLSSVFHVVQHVRHLKSVDERKLEYLKQMNLEKLNVWCLVQFSKCVFLNPDCLILRNCDELFQHEELSATPDTGWPDCFNAGVFVFAPSVRTLSKLVELSQRQGQNNEGDQMLLNAYFNSWSSDMSKKLSFIYNLMRNASYTYGPAFQRFGHNVKIVQFLGGSKPWEVKFSTQTGQLEDDGDVHPKHVRFFSEWINTFKIAVLKLFPQDVYTYAFNQRSVSAEDIGLALCFPALCEDLEQRLVKPEHILPKRRTVSQLDSTGKDAGCNTSTGCDMICDRHSVEEAAQELISTSFIEQNGKIGYEVEKGIAENATESPVDESLPGATIGDYQGMKAWEQGHIDYEGCDRSENIMNRLSFLIHRCVTF